jgi:serine/threonine-protein kinase RsbW
MSSDSEGQALAAGTWRSALRWRRVFPGEARELATLRRFLAVLLPECGARDDVICVATELGSNAIRHTASGRDGRFAVEVVWDAAAVHVAVCDGGAPTGPRVIEEPRQESGRGLLLVRSLSRTCGVCGDQRGRVVWADVPWADPEAMALGRWVAAVGDGGEILGGTDTEVPGWLGLANMPRGLAGRARVAAVASGGGCPPVPEQRSPSGAGLSAGRRSA